MLKDQACVSSKPQLWNFVLQVLSPFIINFPLHESSRMTENEEQLKLNCHF